MAAMSIRSALVASMIALAALNAPAAAQGCLGPSESRAAVARGEAVPLSRVAGNLDGQILDAELCQGGGGLVWRVRMLDRDSVRRTVVIDAQSGTMVSGG